MIKLISLDDAIKAMLKEQQDDIKAYGCAIPEGFDGDRAVRVLMQLSPISDISQYSDRLWLLAYERGKRDANVLCKDCKNRCSDNSCYYSGIITTDDGFCNHGERRIEDGKE